MSTALIDLANQCCDADEYLDMGYLCAKAGYCYNPLRPIGAALWFSMPYAFNTSENIFFYIHVILLALIGISVFYLLKKILPTCIFLLASLFLTWPTFFHTLTDTPATLFFIEGVVLALLGMNRNSAIIFFLAGISLGLSALLRAAYFYPLVVASILFFIYWLWQKNRQWPAVLVISLFIPLLLQFFSVWKYTGHWRFLSEGNGRSMMSLHLNSAAPGYDTYLPQTSAYWSLNCTAQAGLLPSLKSADIPSSICILKSRLSFYLGSYAPSTYLGNKARNFFDNSNAEKIKSDRYIQTRSAAPLPTGEYHHTVFLWAEKNNQSQPVHLQFDNIAYVDATATEPASESINPLLGKSISITNTPQRYTTTITNHTAGYIIARVDSEEKFSMQYELLEPAATASALFQSSSQMNYVMGKSGTLTKNSRQFSKIYLIINCLIILFAAIYLLILLVKSPSPIVIFVGALLLAVFVQCLIIIPEQRYMQGVLCVCWLFSVALLFNRPKHA